MRGMPPTPTPTPHTHSCYGRNYIVFYVKLVGLVDTTNNFAKQRLSPYYGPNYNLM